MTCLTLQTSGCRFRQHVNDDRKEGDNGKLTILGNARGSSSCVASTKPEQARWSEAPIETQSATIRYSATVARPRHPSMSLHHTHH